MLVPLDNKHPNKIEVMIIYKNTFYIILPVTDGETNKTNTQVSQTQFSLISIV